MKESSEIEPISYGPAAISMNAGERGIEVSFKTFITGRDVVNTPLQISGVEEHTCEFEEETGRATRRLKNGKVETVSTEKMKKIRDARIAQGRTVNKVAKTKKNNDIEK